LESSRFEFLESKNYWKNELTLWRWKIELTLRPWKNELTLRPIVTPRLGSGRLGHSNLHVDKDAE